MKNNIPNVVINTGHSYLRKIFSISSSRYTSFTLYGDSQYCYYSHMSIM